MTTTIGITDDQIAALRDEAAAAGDYDQVIICDVALGETDFGALAVEMTRDEARAECARIVSDIQAQA